MTRGWAEKQPLGDLPAYAKAEGSDIQQFASFDEEANNLIEASRTPRRGRAKQAAGSQGRKDILVVRDESGDARRRPPKEFDPTVTDLQCCRTSLYFMTRGFRRRSSFGSL